MQEKEKEIKITMPTIFPTWMKFSAGFYLFIYLFSHFPFSWVVYFELH
jgi:hypothetical protein